MTSRRAVRYVWPAVPPGGAAEPDASPATSLPGLDIVQTVVEDAAQQRRPQLASALELVGSGAASVMVVPTLRTLAGSLRELVGVIDWLEAAGGALVTEDTGLDTASPAGSTTVALLREVASWEDSPGPDRPSRGRPSLNRLAPELAERIVSLRAGGMSLQAVADQLNAEGIPTPRGGTRWRPSSVQAALGYRRPRPPMPGMPPPPPHVGRPPHAGPPPNAGPPPHAGPPPDAGPPPHA